MIEVVDQGTSIIVRYTDDDTGGSATATVVGMDKTTVEERAESIVDAHNLPNQASEQE